MRLILGVGVALIRDKKVLLGFHTARKYENPCWAMPGGHVKDNETIFNAAKREIEEETGMIAKKFRPITFYDDFVDDYRVLSFQLLCSEFDGNPKLMEPNKVNEWKWFDLYNLPENLTQNVKKFLADTNFTDLVSK